MNSKVSIPDERIEKKIMLIRNQKVMLDADLADLYEVETGALVRQVKRNLDRFPSDFAFQLSDSEWESLRCQNGISNDGRGGRRYAPYVFSEHGIVMLSSVLKSKRAAEVNIQIVRTFVKLRELLTTHKDLARKIGEMESKYDQQFRIVFDTIRQMLEPTTTKKSRIGFVIHSEDE